MKENILFITNQIVYPPTDGGKKITLSLIMQFYQQKHNVIVVSFDVVGQDRNPSIKFFQEKNIHYQIVQTKKAYFRKNFFLYIIDYFFDLFSHLPRYAQSRTDVEVKEKINNIIQNFQITKIYLDSIWLSENIDSLYKDKVFLIEHNVEYILSLELAKVEKNPLKKLLLFFETFRIFFYEKKQLKQYPYIIFLSPYDRDFAIRKFKLTPEKCGINNNNLYLEYSITHKGDDNYILFTGSLLFSPNLQGICWFLNHCFPTILSHYPQIVLKISGECTDKIKNKIQKKYKNVIFTGLVPEESMKELYTHCKCVISPILSGSGIKIKNIEAIQLGVPIVMTEFSGRGIQKTNNDKVKLCHTNSPYEFTLKLLEILKENNKN